MKEYDHPGVVGEINASLQRGEHRGNILPSQANRTEDSKGRSGRWPHVSKQRGLFVMCGLLKTAKGSTGVS